MQSNSAVSRNPYLADYYRQRKRIQRKRKRLIRRRIFVAVQLIVLMVTIVFLCKLFG